ncbi:MAG: DUF1684 domain-containing protein [Acidobacteria bacterium]|nr:DUF1684 domain-containing protein [Acidobacteriota bacterium]
MVWARLQSGLSSLCAYGRSDFVCPQTPAENRLPFAIRAGEKGRAHQPLPVDAAKRS